MEKDFLLRKLLFVFLMGLLFLPLVIMLAQVGRVELVWDPFLLVVAKGAFLQATLSALVTVIGGCVGAMGLCQLASTFPPSRFRLICFLITLPSFLPPLLIVLLGAQFFDIVPGLVGVVGFHVLMNVGIASFLIFNLVDKKAAYWLRDAYLLNVPKWKFLSRGLLRELKADLLQFFTYFFFLFFFSFSIPLLIGGAQFGGIEVYIYEKIFYAGGWAQALGYIILFYLAVMPLALVLKLPTGLRLTELSQQRVFLQYLSLPGAILIAVAPMALLLSSYLMFGFFGLLFNLGLFHWQAFLGTLSLGLGVGLCCFLMLSLFTYCYSTGRSTQMLLLSMNPSWVLVGFAYLLVAGDQFFVRYLALCLGLSTLFFPLLVRLNFMNSLNRLSLQVRLSELMPVTWWRTYRQVIFPQIVGQIGLLSGLAGVWACGDFALSELLIDSTHFPSLAVQMKQMVLNYRAEQAIGHLLPLSLCCALVFFSLQGIAYVSRKES